MVRKYSKEKRLKGVPRKMTEEQQVFIERVNRQHRASQKGTGERLGGA